jgi:hypothetical protein
VELCLERQLMGFKTRTALSLIALAACVLAVGLSAASFTETQKNPQTISAAADFLPPTVSAGTIGKSQGGLDGTIRPGGTYYVYANVSDPGNPASGTSSVKANVSSITSGQTAVALTTSGGPYTVDGVSYNYRSAQLTAGSIAAGAKSYKLTLADSAGNSAESGEYSVTVAANTAFKGSGFAAENGPGAESTPDTGDLVVFTFNKEPDPYSIVSGWNGSGTKSVTVSIANNASNDTLSVSGATIGTVALDGDFTAGSATFSGSTISISGSTVTIVLGTASGSVKANTAKSKPVWTPSGSVFDLVGNLCSTATVTGANKKLF